MSSIAVTCDRRWACWGGSLCNRTSWTCRSHWTRWTCWSWTGLTSCGGSWGRTCCGDSKSWKISWQIYSLFQRKCTFNSKFLGINLELNVRFFWNRLYWWSMDSLVNINSVFILSKRESLTVFCGDKNINNNFSLVKTLQINPHTGFWGHFWPSRQVAVNNFTAVSSYPS